MIAEALINPLIPTLHPSDTAQSALKQMENLHLQCLPVVEKETYQGFVSENTLLNLSNAKRPISGLALDGSEAYVNNTQHLYDVLRTSAQYKTDLVAVLDDKQQYMGSITAQDLVNTLSSSYSIQQNGGILVLSIFERDYSLSEITRLVESNNAKVLNAVVDSDPTDHNKMFLTLKINQSDLSRVVATLERFSYQVVELYHQAQTQSIDKERLDMLFRFLNI